MADVHSPEVRSKNMRAIRSTDTKPELGVRRYLHSHGFRFRLHDKRLPGKPDIVLPKWKTVIFIDGCFWHMHDCRYFRLPGTRTEFWQEKLAGNKARDEASRHRLEELGWRIIVVYECELKDAPTETLARLSCSLSLREETT